MSDSWRGSGCELTRPSLLLVRLLTVGVFMFFIPVLMLRIPSSSSAWTLILRSSLTATRKLVGLILFLLFVWHEVLLRIIARIAGLEPRGTENDLSR